MLNLNKCTTTKPKPQHSSLRTADIHVCAYHCVQLSYTTQHKTVLIIFPLILQTIIIAETILSNGWEGGAKRMPTCCSVDHADSADDQAVADCVADLF